MARSLAMLPVEDHLRKRLTTEIVREPITDCWIWQGASSPKGYGSIRTGRFTSAHRATYELFIGPIPKGMSVLHTCDEPACVNPDHLKLGTAKDNTADMVSKGRQNFWGHSGKK